MARGPLRRQALLPLAAPATAGGAARSHRARWTDAASERRAPGAGHTQDRYPERPDRLDRTFPADGHRRWRPGAHHGWLDSESAGPELRDLRILRRRRGRADNGSPVHDLDAAARHRKRHGDPGPYAGADGGDDAE